ncbi:hypothetical protein [Vibrio barjaei]|uniref:hypothetical protein n=1 Tax=Vibrio barjaei TaxID=1676683 RepID=UPI002284F236|nr:hypothetical protein [Vibrio barjaei]MCY9873867.1 hypothetical protein [Vibrio barjaei]
MFKFTCQFTTGLLNTHAITLVALNELDYTIADSKPLLDDITFIGFDEWLKEFTQPKELKPNHSYTLTGIVDFDDVMPRYEQITLVETTPPTA